MAPSPSLLLTLLTALLLCNLTPTQTDDSAYPAFHAPSIPNPPASLDVLPPSSPARRVEDYLVVEPLFSPVYFGSFYSRLSFPAQGGNDVKSEGGNDDVVSPPRGGLTTTLTADLGPWVEEMTAGYQNKLPPMATVFVCVGEAGSKLVKPEPEYILPERLTFSELCLLEINSRLSTVESGRYIVITNNSVSNFTVNNRLLISPDAFVSSTVIIHGLANSTDSCRQRVANSDVLEFLLMYGLGALSVLLIVLVGWAICKCNRAPEQVLCTAANDVVVGASMVGSGSGSAEPTAVAGASSSGAGLLRRKVAQGIAGVVGMLFSVGRGVTEPLLDLEAGEIVNQEMNQPEDNDEALGGESNEEEQQEDNDSDDGEIHEEEEEAAGGGGQNQPPVPVPIVALRPSSFEAVRIWHGFRGIYRL